MKKIFSICAIAAGAIALASCSDFLDQTSPSEQNTENVYNSEYYTSTFINKIYGGLTQDRTYSQDLAIIYGMNSDIELVDGLGSTATANSERGAMNYNATSAWSKLSDMWTAMYGVIENCNLAIDGINNSSIKNNSAMQHYLGEAKTIRAMLYFDLIRIFGDIPMKLEPTQSDLSNADLGKTDRDEIMDTLMNNLEEACDELPWAGESSYTTEHATAGYAHALLAQIAMTYAGYSIRESAKTGYETASYSDATYPTQRPGETERKALYEKALKHLSIVINKGIHSLNPSFDNEWTLINQLTLDKTYYENLFEIPMLQNVSGELGYTVGVRLNGTTTTYGYSNSTGKLKLTSDLFYSYDENDSRRDVTCSNIQIIEGKNKNGVAATTTAMLGNTPFAIYAGKWDPRKENSTWLSQNKAANAKHLTGINPVKIRYSQVLLWYAEVMNELAGPDASSYTDSEGNILSAGMSARQALKLVHVRAFDSAYKSSAAQCIDNISSDKTAFFNAIVQENAWELAGEGARKYDLIRWNLLTEKILEMKAQYLEDIDAAVANPTTNSRYQKTVYFNYTDSLNTTIDESSITWYGIPSGKTSADYTGNTSSFGNSNDTQIKTNLPSICSGLVGSSLSPSTTPDVDVKNRYLMPLGSSTIADSNGKLSNSYGYK